MLKVGEEREHIYLLLHCHHQNDSCSKMSSDESHFNVSLIVRGKVTRQCPQTTTFLKRKESRSGIEPRPFCLPTQRLTVRPDRLTVGLPVNVRASPPSPFVVWCLLVLRGLLSQLVYMCIYIYIYIYIYIRVLSVSEGRSRNAQHPEALCQQLAGGNTVDLSTFQRRPLFSHLSSGHR